MGGRAIRSLVLSVDIGAGHRRAAEALCDALAQIRPQSRHRIIEALEYLGPDGGKLAKEMYFGVLEDAPGIWGAIYGARELHDLFRPLGEIADDVRINSLVPLVREERPDVILAMHPIACGLASALARRGAFHGPVVAVLTDFDAHPSWVARGIHLYLVATAEMARDLERRGLPSGRVAATGIPLRMPFATIRENNDARRRLGLDPYRFCVLLLGGGLGLGPIAEVAEALAPMTDPVQVVVMAGKNADLTARAQALAARAKAPIHVTGHVENVWDYVAAADLAVGKPGGLTAAELCARGVPLVALDPIPGQEQANCDVLVKLGAAVAARTAAEANTKIRRLLLSPADLENMRRAALRIGRPGAAPEAAREVARLVDARAG